MKPSHRAILLVCTILFAGVPGILHAQYPMLSGIHEGKEIRYWGDKILVKFSEGLSEDSRQKFARDFDARIVRHHFGEWYSLDLPKGTDPLDLVPIMSARPEAAFVEADGVITAADDFSNQWGLHNTRQTINPPGGPITGTADADRDVLEAWSITKGDVSVRIGMVDTEIDSRPPGFIAGGQAAGNFPIENMVDVKI